MKKESSVSNRISPDFLVSKETYLSGLFDIQRRLFNELVVLLRLEDRAFGIMKEYIRICSEAFIGEDTTEEEQEIYDRILFLLKPVFLKEFKRLTKRRLSPADAVITIMHKSLDIILEMLEEESPVRKNVLLVKDIVDRVWENIKNRTKKDAMYYYSDLIKTLMGEGVIGKYPLSSITFRDEQKKEPLKNPGVRFKEESPGKIIEINLL